MKDLHRMKEKFQQLRRPKAEMPSELWMNDHTYQELKKGALKGYISVPRLYSLEVRIDPSLPHGCIETDIQRAERLKLVEQLGKRRI